MAKADIMMEGREQGIRTAMRVIDQECGRDNPAYRALEKELRFRRKSGVQSTMTMREVERAAETIKEYSVQSTLAMSMVILWDMFGFGKKRLQRFRDEFDIHAFALIKGEISWIDIFDSLQAAAEIELLLPEELRRMRERDAG